MKELLYIGLMLVSFATNAQVIDGIMVNQAGQIAYNEVVEMEGMSQYDLYMKARGYQLSNFATKGVTLPVYVDDQYFTQGEFTVDIAHTAGPVKMFYTERIECKDGRYRYTYFDIKFQNYPNSMFPYPEPPVAAEKILDKAAYYKNNGTPRSSNETYKVKMLEALKEQKQLLHAAMSPTKTQPGFGDDDW